MNKYPKKLDVLGLSNILDLRNRDDGGNGPLGKNGSVLSAQDDGPLVEHVQRMLKDLKYDLGDSGPANDGIDGKFGNKTEKAVKKFQRSHKDWLGKKLKDDGLVGIKTADSLNRAMVGKWYDEYKTQKELTKDLLLITITDDALQKGLTLFPEDEKRAKVVLVQTGTWIELQTVNELGHRVGNFDLILVLPDGTQRTIKTDANGYYRSKKVPQGEIEVILQDGTPAKYISRGKETVAIIHTDLAAQAITQIVVNTLTPEELEEYQKNIESYKHRKEKEEIGGRTQRFDPDTGKHTGESTLVPTHRSMLLAVDNLALAAGMDKNGEINLSKLFEVLKIWLQDYHQITQVRGYILLVYKGPDRQISIYDRDGKQLESLRINHEITGLIGIYAPFEMQQGIDLWVDMTPQHEYSVFVKGRENEVIPIEDILDDENLIKFNTICEVNSDKVRILFNLGTTVLSASGKISQLEVMAFHGGTGILEPYSDNDEINNHVHERNIAVIRTVRRIYEEYIQGYIKDVKKAKNEDEIRNFGPPRSIYLFPRPPGAKENQMLDLFKKNDASSLHAWIAIAEQLDTFAERHSDGALFFRVKIELKGVWKGELSPYMGAKLEYNFDIGTDGWLQKLKTPVLGGIKGEKAFDRGPPINIPLSKTYLGHEAFIVNGDVEHEADLRTGKQKSTFKLKVGPKDREWGFEISDDGKRKLTGPYGVYSEFNSKTGEFGGGDCLIIKGGRETKLQKEAKFCFGIHMQGLRPETILAFTCRAPGFFERRKFAVLLERQWNDLYPDEQARLEVLGWKLDIWDNKRDMEIDKFPSSAKNSFDELSSAKKCAAVALGLNRDGWEKIWMEVAKK